MGCFMEEDVDYWGGKDVGHVEGVDSADGCCDECAQRADCQSWTWISDTFKHEDRHLRCHLKSGKTERKENQPGLVSGTSAAAPTSDSPSATIPPGTCSMEKDVDYWGGKKWDMWKALTV